MTTAGSLTGRWPDFDGRLSVDGEALTEASRDFGGVVQRRPAAVLRAGSVDDVVRMVRHARAAGLQLVPRGAGHAAFGQAQITGGVVVDLRGLDRVHSLDDRAITVDAGVLWSELVRRTTAVGLVPPVLTDFLELTVGGTLSAGGITGTSFQWGAQIDNVDEIVVVTGAGDVVRCSPTEEPELFEAVLAGFGQVAIIVRAAVRLVPAPPAVEVFRLRYDDMAAMTTELRSLVSDGRFDYLLGIVTPTDGGGWRASIEAAVGSDRPDSRGISRRDGLRHRRAEEDYEIRSLTEWVRRVDEPVGVLRELGLWQAPHPWLDLFVRDSALGTMLSEVVDPSVPRGVGPLRILLYPLRRSRFGRPLLRLPEDEDLVLLDVLSTAPAAGPEAMVAANRRLFERNRELGGTVYPISAVPLQPDDWRRQFGPRWQHLTAARRRFDPDGVLTHRGAFGAEPPA